MADLLQLLKILIRSVGRVGDGTEAALVDHVSGRLEIFSQLTTAPHEKDLINQIRDCVDSVKKQLLAKTQSGT
jgi:hypothetical protein